MFIEEYFSIGAKLANSLLTPIGAGNAICTSRLCPSPCSARRAICRAKEAKPFHPRGLFGVAQATALSILAEESGWTSDYLQPESMEEIDLISERWPARDR